MVFSSLIFLCAFLPITLALYFVSYKFINLKASNIVLLVMSLLFMFWGSGSDMLVLFSVVLINYFGGLLLLSGTNGLLLTKVKRTRYQKTILVFTLILSFGILFYYKYAGFVTENVVSLFELMGIQVEMPNEFSEIILPLGISFYTFQALSYTLDVYFGNVEATASLPNFALYVTLFPQIIAGPIVRYKDIYKQITVRSISFDHIYEGTKRFMVGFVKKVLLANTVAMAADKIFALPIEQVHFSIAWIGIVAYSLQIFLDFSAYSDMAIGLAKIFGFDLLENFNYPYIAKSVQDFWRRWHISLSSWFRDYLYIPLGGSRKGKGRTYLNLLIVFLLCGLWHGAAWVFIIWGLWHGIFLIIERLFLGKVLKKIPSFLGHIYTVLVAMVGWVFFRSTDLIDALRYIKRLFLPTEFYGSIFRNPMEYLQNDVIIAIVFGVLVSAGVFKWLYAKSTNKWKGFEVVFTVLLLACFVLSIASVYNNSYNPFIYFRF